MKKLLFLLAFVASLCSCSNKNELLSYYEGETALRSEANKEIALCKDDWTYVDDMKNLITYEIVISLSPKIGKEIESWVPAGYEKYAKLVSMDEQAFFAPYYGSEDYQNIQKLQEEAAYQAVVEVLKAYKKPLGMEYQSICQEVIVSAMQAHPVYFE